MTKKKIKLHGKRGKGKYMLIDEDDYDSVIKHRWWLMVRGDISTGINGKKIKLHRFIMNVTDPKIQVDHLNGDRLDNRRENLRLVSNKTNARNRHYKKPNTSSKYIGVVLDKRVNLVKRWIAQIKVDYKYVHLGRHKTEDEAGISYNKAAQKFGFLTRNEVI